MSLRFKLQYPVAAAAFILSGCGAGSSITPSGSTQPTSASPLQQARLHPSSGAETILHEFGGKGDSGVPLSTLIADPSGNLLGTAAGDNGRDPGSVFKIELTKHGATESVVHQFKGGKDGAVPVAGLVTGKNGVLFGTTAQGGSSCEANGCGVAFELAPSGAKYKERILHAFGMTEGDGIGPEASLFADGQGALYGTTTFAGANDVGTVYKLMPEGSTFAYSVIYSFAGGVDAEYPMAPVVVDANGTVFGTTTVGGSGNGGTGCGEGCGAVFQLAPSGSGYAESVLYNFQGSPDGAMPYAGLLADGTGAFYGTTLTGGAAASSNCPNGCGTVFKLVPTGSGYAENVLYRFQGGADGNGPRAAVIAGSNGVLYGTTVAGGAAGLGTVFALTPSGSGYVESVLYSFEPAHDGADPIGGLLFGSDGRLFGTTSHGEKQKCLYGGCGAVFALTL